MVSKCQGNVQPCFLTSIAAYSHIETAIATSKFRWPTGNATHLLLLVAAVQAITCVTKRLLGKGRWVEG